MTNASADCGVVVVSREIRSSAREFCRTAELGCSLRARPALVVGDALDPAVESSLYSHVTIN